MFQCYQGFICISDGHVFVNLEPGNGASTLSKTHLNTCFGEKSMFKSKIVDWHVAADKKSADFIFRSSSGNQ